MLVYLVSQDETIAGKPKSTLEITGFPHVLRWVYIVVVTALTLIVCPLVSPYPNSFGAHTNIETLVATSGNQSAAGKSGSVLLTQ